MRKRRDVNDIVGKKFYRLTVLSYHDRVNNSDRYLCRCDCGVEKVIIRNNFVRTKGSITKSCGCLNLEKSFTAFKTHGMTGTRLHRVWCSMLQRCSDPNANRYKNYGERGIIVCEEWKNDFVVFKDFALANGYKDNLQIDRINNDGNYEPSNCRFVTNQQNSLNRGGIKLNPMRVRIIKKLIANGFTQHKVAELYGIARGTVGGVVNNRIWANG